MNKYEDEERSGSGGERFSRELYKMVVRRLALQAQRLEEIISTFPEGAELPPGITLEGNDGFSFTSEVEPIALGQPVEITFFSTPGVRVFAKQFGLDTQHRLDVGLHTDTDDEDSFRRLRERIGTGEGLGDTTYLFDLNGSSIKLSFLPNGEIKERDVVVPFKDGGFVASTMTPGDIELAGSIIDSLTSRASSIQSKSPQA